MLLAYWSEASSEQGRGTWTLGSCSKVSLKCTTCSVMGEERQQCRLEIWVHTVLNSNCHYKRQWNFSGDGNAAHTDYRAWHSSFYSFGKWGLKKALHLLIVPENGKAEWERKPLIPWMKRNTWNTSSKSYAWCSLETGIQSCMNSEMLSSSFLGSPNIFTKGASLWGIVSFSTCLALDRKDKRVPLNTWRELPLNKLTGCVCGKHGVKYPFHWTEPQGKSTVRFPPLLCSGARA